MDSGAPETEPNDGAGPRKAGRRRRRNLTRSEVEVAAEALLARGEAVSVPAIRAILGGGSPRTIQDGLREWRSGLAQRLDGAARGPDIPARVRSAFESVWSQACADAESRRPGGDVGEGEREDLRGALEALRGELARHID